MEPIRRAAEGLRASLTQSLPNPQISAAAGPEKCHSYETTFCDAASRNQKRASRQKDCPVSTMLIIASLGVGAAALAALSVRFRRRRPQDMGVMNDQWLAEQRLTHGPDPNR